jgi:hypothetical protein
MPAAYRVAGYLRAAALLFVMLTACAMATYAGGTWFDPYESRYQLGQNFLSDLGMTHAWSGRANTVSSVLFGAALVGIGVALVAFAWVWRGFAFERGRARLVGHASALLGTAAGLAFVGVAVTPFDLVLATHIALVIAAFGLLTLYVAAITFVMWRNALRGSWLAANLGYLALVGAYVALVVVGPQGATPHDHAVQVIGQKVVAYGSMLHAVFVATMVRSRRQTVAST